MKILVTGLNSALQKTLTFETFRAGEVNRAKEIHFTVGGKGGNFCRAARTYGTDTTLYQFVGGWAGNRIERILDIESFSHRSVTVTEPTRVCTTCLCQKSGTMTELIEPSGHVPETERQILLDQILGDLPKFSAIALCGTFPPGIDENFYATIARTAANAGTPVLLDACQNILPTLEASVTILKINRAELAGISGCPDIRRGIRSILDSYPVGVVAVTDGAGKAYLAERNGSALFHFAIPKLADVVNPLGAGDTVSAVMFSEYLSGHGARDAFAAGLAAGSASCLRIKVADYDPEVARKLRNAIVISEDAPRAT
jgi:tagatose 6-phosphate kinase